MIVSPGFRIYPCLAACLLLGFATPNVYAASDESATVSDLKVTILSTMLATPGIGEWGFAALVEADGHRILFDTGGRPDVVLENVLFFPHLIKDFVERKLSEKSYQIFEVRETEVQKSTYTKVANEKLANGADEKTFYETKLVTGRFFMERLLPDTSSLLAKLTAGSKTMMALDAEAF